MTSSMQLQRPHCPTKRSGPPSRTCRFCFKSFSKSEHLTRHERSHTKERPFRCKSCGKCYSRNDTLIRHGKVHNKGKSGLKVPTKSDELPISRKLHAVTAPLVDLKILTSSDERLIEFITSPTEGLNDVSAIDPNLQNDQHNQPMHLTMEDFISDHLLDESIYDVAQNSKDSSLSFSTQPVLCNTEADSHYPLWHLEDDFDLQAFNNSLLAPDSVHESSLWVTSPMRQDGLVAATKADPYTSITDPIHMKETSYKNDSSSYSVAPMALTTMPSGNKVDNQHLDEVSQGTRPRWKDDPPLSSNIASCNLGKSDSYASTISEPGTPTLFHQVLPNFPYPSCTYFSSQ